MGVSWLHLDVRSASVSATALVAVAVALRVGPRRRWTAFVSAAAVETALVCGLFAVWQVANGMAHTHHAGGLANGRWVWDVERTLHVPSETSLQRLVLGWHWLIRASNYYYATAHLTAMVVFLCWLWLRHRDRYPRWRNALVLFTLMSLLMQMVPVAPPRLIGGTGLVDTAAAYGQSVYAVFGSSIADQMAAMPSIHVGWAVLIACAVWSVSTSRWRWVGPAHAVVTALVVVWTANHYWLDGGVAVGLLGFAWLGALQIDRWRRTAPVVEEVEPIPLSQAAPDGRMAV